MSSVGRTCNLCGSKVAGGLEGLIAHGHECHPDHYLSGAGKNGETAGRTLEFVEKNYWCPLDEKWYASRKYLARTIKSHGLTNEGYFLKYGQEHMPKEWKELTNDPKYGDAASKPDCLQCGKHTKFNEQKWTYPVFCGFSCSTKWHAENTDRIDRAMKTNSERKELDPTHQLRPNQIAYWTTRGHTEDEAKALVSERQKAGNLDRMIDKHGQELGVQLYNEGLSRRKEAILKSDMFTGSSRIAEQMFKEVEDIHGKPLFYGQNERHIYCGEKGKYIWVDCLDDRQRKVIEFFGDYWHASPHKYKGEDVMKYSRSGGSLARDIWKYDEDRIARIKRAGYEVLIIWEHQYKQNPEWALTKAIGFLENIEIGDMPPK